MASKFCLCNFATTNIANLNLQFTLGQGESRSCRDRKDLFPHNLQTDILCLPRLGATCWECVALNSKGWGKALGCCTKILQKCMQIWGDWVAGMLNLAMQNIKKSKIPESASRLSVALTAVTWLIVKLY